MPRDDIDHIPSIVPSREGVAETGARTRRRADRGKAGQPPGGSGGAGWLAGLCITVALVAALAACIWAWQLQQRVEERQAVIDDYSLRIGDLEARLSDTDEGMNQNAEVQAAKLRELDSEVRKLWDNVWKKSKARLAALEAASSSQDKRLSGVSGSVDSIEAAQKAATADIQKLKSVAGDLSRLMASAKASQAEMERLADTLNRIELDLAKLNKRVQSNEEWVGSINAFRRQINASLTELQTAVRAMQQGP